MVTQARNVLSFIFSFVVLFIHLKPLEANETRNKSTRDYCIIGAGPGGLQMGYFLKRANRDYVIFERANSSGAFYMQYPRHRKLISINKRYTGKTNKEFNLRHDWNSLISDDESLQMRWETVEITIFSFLICIRLNLHLFIF